MRIKDLVPEVFYNKEKWRKWRTDVEDYIETFESGMKAVSKTAVMENEEIEEGWFDEFLFEDWNKSREFYKLLKAKTSGERRQVVLGVGNDNGWEAWRRLAQHFEPNSAVRRGQVLPEL